MVTVFGTPSIRLRPLISIVSGLIQRRSGAKLNLDLLGRALADQQIIFALQIAHDGVVHLVAGDANGTRIDNAGKRNDRDIRRAAANIHHHVPGGFRNRQSCADGRYHGLFDQMDFARLRPVGRFD